MFDPRGPLELILYPLYRCNSRCWFCKYSDPNWQPPAKAELSVELIRKVIEKYPTIRNVCIAGFGEPLLWKNLGEAITYLKDQGKFVNVITNGSLLKDKVDLLRAVDQISISLNATTAEGHERITGTQYFERVLEGIGLAKKQVHGRVGVSFVCHNGNITKIPDFIRLGNQFQVDFVDLLSLLPHAYSSPEGEKEFWRMALTDRHAAAIEQYKALPGSRIVRTWPTLLIGEPPRRCQSPFVSMGIDARGYITGCRRIEHPQPEPKAHIDAPDVWNGEYYTALREAMRGQRPLPERCQMCSGNWSG